MSKVYSVSDDDFITLVKNSFSNSDVLRSLGLSTNGGASVKILKRRMADLGCDTSHYKYVRKCSPKYDLDQILVVNSSYRNIKTLKKRLLSSGLLKYVCSLCGNSGEWLGSKLSLQLDHVNGVSDDHRLENLRFLCPNCHSQTDTYAGKNATRQKS